MRTLALLAFALVAAGCTGPAAEPLPAAPAPDLRLTLLPPTTVFDPCENRFGTCFEPTIAANPAGTVFATSGIGGPVARTRDRGVTWEAVDPPALEGVPETGFTVHNDVILQVDPQGRLFYSSLVTTIAGGIVLHGVQVSRSDDEGATWPVRTFVGLPSTTHATLGADRQWLAFGPEGEVYLQYHRIDPVLAVVAPIALLAGDVRVARSDDGGATFGPFAMATGLGTHIGGQPAVASDGTLYVPYFEVRRDLSGTRLLVARSADGGATFTPEAIEVPGTSAGDFFPVAFADGDTVRVVFKDGSERVRLATRGADGAWSEPVLLSDEETAGSPWGEARNGTLHVAWAVRDGRDAHVAYRQLDASLAEVAALDGPSYAAPGVRPNTDFTHFAVLPDGLPALVWTDESRDLQVSVAALV